MAELTTVRDLALEPGFVNPEALATKATFFPVHVSIATSNTVVASASCTHARLACARSNSHVLGSSVDMLSNESNL